MKQFKRLIIPYFIWAIVILVIPLFLIALYAFTTEGNEVMTLSFTWGNFAKFLEATYLNVILKSFWLWNRRAGCKDEWMAECGDWLGVGRA